MAKKVALDVLDIELDHTAPEETPDLAVLPEEPQAAADPESAEKRRPWTWPAGLRRPRLWLLALGIVAVLTMAALALLYDGAGRPKEPEPGPALTARADQAPATEPLILLTGFVVDLTDSQGRARILFCDAALLPEKRPAAQDPRDWTEARNLIYRTLKGQKFEDLLSATGREQIKATLIQGLNSLGEGPAVQAIYFTAFEIL